jgi:glycogen operon protein
MLNVTAGTPDPLGTTPGGTGVNFAVFAGGADCVDLCLFDADTGAESRYRLFGGDNGVFHAHVQGIGAGQLYGFRAHGRYAVDSLRFNANKLLLDPYARAISGPILWDPAIYDFKFDFDPDLVLNEFDSASEVPRSVVVDTQFDWGDDARPNVPLEDTIVYEAHVKGLTRLHEKIPEQLRGTYLGLTEEPIIKHLTELGITTVELMPVQEFASEGLLARGGQVNYWGYEPIGHFAPTGRYSSNGDRGPQVEEFKTMVKRLHAAKLEVVLDVVFTHAGEENARGPSYCFKGLSNPTYYMLGEQRRDLTGTGNTFNVVDKQALKLVLDCLRYWVIEMHVDGFRFDLASILALDPDSDDLSFHSDSPFFEALAADSVLNQVKLFAEPWAVNDRNNLYGVGQFPKGWGEWNDGYRKAARNFWAGKTNDDSRLSNLANRIAGSFETYSGDRGPLASVNYVVSHDGLTLRDLTGYSNTDEAAWDCRSPGTPYQEAEALRQRQQRNFLLMLFTATGVPLLLGGSEFGRTQLGVANAYDHDDSVSWFDWNWDADQQALFDFTSAVIRLRSQHRILRRKTFFTGQPSGGDLKDITWLRPDGAEMSAADWANPDSKVIGFRIAGDSADDGGAKLPADDTLLILLSAWWNPIPFRLPSAGVGHNSWQRLIDTSVTPIDWPAAFAPGDMYPLTARSSAVFSTAVV